MILKQQTYRIFDHAAPNDPSGDSNPPRIPFIWLNSVSGEMFSCTDTTVDVNVWRGTLGTEIN